MTREEIVKEIVQLPVAEREAMVEEIRRSIRKDLQPVETRVSIVDQLYGIAKPDTAAQSSAGSEDPADGHLSLSQRLYGILEFENGPPTDDEVKDMIADHLIEKYS
jgi:hypothetical protein